MINQVKRLRKWMNKTGYDTKSLNAALGYEVDMVGRIISGKAGVGRSFRRLFARRFGEPIAFALFDQPIAHDSKHTGTGMHPEREAANREITLKINRSTVFPADAFQCYFCPKPAVHNHHPSYDSEHRLCVVALCRSCHVRVHTGSLKLNLGIMPTPVGYILVAIHGA
jgi:hypothetical protein